MHPILAHRGRLAPYLAACAPLAAILTALLARPGGLFLGEAVALAVPLTFAYAFMGLSAWYPCRQAPLVRSRALPLVLTHAAAAALVSATWVGLGVLLAAALGLVPAFAGLPGRFSAQAVTLFAAGVLLYLLAAALNYVLLALDAAAEAERREAELAILAREAELAALKAQIRPHFLFNSLNSIASLAASDPPRAQQMCVKLGDFLRRSLSLGEKASISVGEELELSRAYLAVEELRFGARLEVEEELDDRGNRCLVPPLLLQPLIENAVRHGIATRVEGGTLRVGVACGGGRLRILVENPYDPESPSRPGGGRGLANVRQRLTARYGEEALFAAKRLADRYLVVISVPAEMSA
ncbi:MAG TPA: histidine kinase [Thermoanaerobaculia bacterium]|nr:histidine kinase [Thermoanaerobaculia bacterium]